MLIHSEKIRIMKTIVISFAALFYVMSVHAQPTVVTTNDASKLANALIGTGITIVGTPKYIGRADQVGTFTGGPASTIGFPQGILLTTGLAAAASGTYTGPDLPDNNLNLPGDSALSALVNNVKTFDAAILEFNFTSTLPTVFFKYTFASAEYPHFENKEFNDVFAFFINGQNYATIPGTSLPVSVNNLNSTKNNQFFGGYNVLGSPSPYGAQTVVLSFTAPVSTTGVNTIRLAIADTADSDLDSAVFLQAGSLSVTSDLVVTGPCPVPAGTQATLYAGFHVSVAGGTPPYSSTFNLPPGLIFDLPTGTVTGTPITSGLAIPISIQVSDSSTPKQTKTYSCTIDIAPSTLNITGPCPVPAGIQGTSYTGFNVATTGGTPPYIYTTSLPPGLTFNPATGAVSGTPTISGTSIPISIQVTDSGTGLQKQTKTYSCSIVISSILNITGPCPAPAGVQGVVYAGFSVPVTGGTPPYIYTTSLPPGLTFNPATGAVSGTPTTSGTSIPISIQVTDSGTGPQKQTKTYSCSIVISSILNITGPCPAPAGVQGASYAGFLVPVSGGTPPYIYTPNLPPGLTFNTATGAVSGTPTTSGIGIPISIQVTDSGTGSQKQTKTYSCAIDIAPTLTISGPCPVPSGTQGVPYTGFSVVVAGGIAPYNYTVTLPPGLTFDQTTGAVKGTPSLSGVNIPISVRVDSGTGLQKQTAIYSCSITIVPPVTLTGPCITGTQNIAYSVTLTATGGNGAYTFSLVAPSWLSLSTPAGAVGPTGSFALTLSGTPPTIGSFPVTVIGKDGFGNTATYNCTIVIIAPKVQLTSASVCPASPIPAGTPFSQNLSATGGNGVYEWAVSIGSLPPGLQLNGSKIFGTPTSPGTYSFSISLNSADQFAETACQLVVTAPALQLTSGCPSDGIQGVAYGPFPLAASGGSGPSSYVFGYTGSLPDGVSLTANTISGLPTKAGVFNFTLQVSSGTKTASSGACSVKIAAPALGIQGTCPGDTQAGGTVSASFSGTGGTPPYSFGFSGPAWLTQSSGTVSGKSAFTDVGSTSFTITVTDAAKATQATTCSFRLTTPQVPAPQITSACPVPAQRAQGSTLTLPLTATGGTPPFTWSYDNGDPDLSITPDSTSLTGILNKLGPFTFTIGLTDNAGAKATALTCSLTVNSSGNISPLLTLTSSADCPTNPLDFGSNFSRTFTAGGGTAPYSWSVTPSDLFTLSPATGPNTSLSGMLTKSGTIPLVVTLNDSASMTRTYPCTLNVNLPPQLITTVVLGLQPPDVTQPVPLSLSVSPSVVFPITGTITLTFTSKATHPSTPPGPATLSAGNPYTFTIPPGSSTFSLQNIQRGKEYGTIHLAVTGLTGAGLIVPPATQDIDVPKLAPVFTANDVQINSSASGFTIVIAGSSSTRDMTGGTITFNAANGATVDGGTVDLGTLGIAKIFDDWYTNAARSMNLTDFKNLTIPVTIEGDKTAITSVTVTLTNSGGSTPVTKSL
jgi:hypothetical protein